MKRSIYEFRQFIDTQVPIIEGIEELRDLLRQDLEEMTISANMPMVGPNGSVPATGEYPEVDEPDGVEEIDIDPELDDTESYEREDTLKDYKQGSFGENFYMIEEDEDEDEESDEDDTDDDDTYDETDEDETMSESDESDIGESPEEDEIPEDIDEIEIDPTVDDTEEYERGTSGMYQDKLENGYQGFRTSTGKVIL